MVGIETIYALGFGTQEKDVMSREHFNAELQGDDE